MPGRLAAVLRLVGAAVPAPQVVAECCEMPHLPSPGLDVLSPRQSSAQPWALPFSGPF